MNRAIAFLRSAMLCRTRSFLIALLRAAHEWIGKRLIDLQHPQPTCSSGHSPDSESREKAQSHHAFVSSLIDHLPVLVFMKRLRGEDLGRIVLWNKTAEAVTGYTAVDVLGYTSTQAFPREVAECHLRQDLQMVADPMIVEEFDVKFRRPDGEQRILHTISVPLFDENDQAEYVLSIAEDFTERHRQQLLLRAKQAELVAVNDASPLGLFRIDALGRCTYLNRTAEIMLGFQQDVVIGVGWMHAVHPKDRLRLLLDWRRAVKYNHALHGVYRFQHAGAATAWISLRIAPILVDARIEGYAGSLDDVTARREAERALAENEQRLRTIADAVQTLVAYVGKDQRFGFVNLAFEHIFKLDRERIRQMTVAELLGPRAYFAIRGYLNAVLRGQRVRFEQESGGDNDWTCSEVTLIPQHDPKSRQVTGFHALVYDITQKRLEENRLRQLVMLDGLTGLLNRPGFESRLENALLDSRKRHTSIALMYLDLDRLKQINDTFGHHIGDLLLKAFAGRLSQAVRSTDAIGRLGGDEFTVLMENLERSCDAEAVAAKIVQTMSAEFVLEGVCLSISASVGVAICTDGRLDAQSLLRKADEMLYQVKRNGRNGYRLALTGPEPRHPFIERPAA